MAMTWAEGRLLVDDGHLSPKEPLPSAEHRQGITSRPSSTVRATLSLPADDEGGGAARVILEHDHAALQVTPLTDKIGEGGGVGVGHPERIRLVGTMRSLVHDTCTPGVYQKSAGRVGLLGPPGWTRASSRTISRRRPQGAIRESQCQSVVPDSMRLVDPFETRSRLPDNIQTAISSPSATFFTRRARPGGHRGPWTVPPELGQTEAAQG